MFTVSTSKLKNFREKTGIEGSNKLKKICRFNVYGVSIRGETESKERKVRV